MILGEENELMADGSNNIQYNDCYSDLTYGSRLIKNVDLNNNNNSINQSNRNQQQSNSQCITQQANHLNLVQFVDQFNNFPCNSLLPNLSTQQQQNISNQQMIYSTDHHLKESNTTSTGTIKIKSENAIDAIDLSSNTNLPNSSNLSSSLPNLSNDLNSLTGIPLLPNTINLHSINLSNCDTIDHNGKCILPNGSSINNNLPANFNELLLNDYPLNANQLSQQNQLNSNLINVQSTHKHQASNLDQSNKINSNNELSPIDMEDQEKIKLERKRMRNRIAASKCRRKKMETLQSLEELVRQLKNENTNLMRLVQDLKEMNYQLKQEVIEHMKRGCNIKTTI